jgi:TetR/AcrR family transcriptional regulator, cholesterol catabolism regulator
MAKIKPGKNATKKEAIIKKGAALFKTKGYNAASMRELAFAVGVEAPSLYNHIGSKTEILQAICFKVAEKFTSQLHTAENSDKSTLEKIEAIIRFHITMMMEEFDEVFVANHEWKHLQQTEKSNFLQQRRNYEKKLAGIIEEGIRKKEIKNINPYVAVLTMLSAVRGLELWQRHKKNIPAKLLLNDMVTHLLTGIKNK